MIWFDKYHDWNKYPANRRSDVRRIFILELGKQLCMPWIKQRAGRPVIGLQPSVKRAMEYVNRPATKKAKEKVSQATTSKGRYHKCPRTKDNKTHIQCDSCDKFVCEQHATKKYMCADGCADDEYTETV